MTRTTTTADRAGGLLILAALVVLLMALAGCNQVATATTTSRPACAWRMVGVSAWATDYVRVCDDSR